MKSPARKFDRARRIALSVICPAIACFSASLAWACAFHMTLPDKRIGDYVLESSQVVLARENPEEHWTFKAVAILKGESASADPDVFLDSSTRRKLEVNPDDTVLLARSQADGSWRRLSYVKSQNRTLFENLVSSSNHWSDPNGQMARFRIFAELHNHPDDEIRRISLTELDRAAYRDLREMQIRVSADSLAEDLWEPYEQSLAPIRILMLGILGDAMSRSLVSQTIASAQMSGWSVNLGAWATAYVEIEGAAGVDHLHSAFLARSDRQQSQIEAVLTALAVQGSGGDPRLRLAIDAAISEVLAKRPDLVVRIAQIFGAQGDYSRARLLTDTLQRHRLQSPTDVITVATYVSIARQSN